MKPEDALLIEKLLDGSMIEQEADILFKKIQDNKIPIEEIKIAMHLHGHLKSQYSAKNLNEAILLKFKSKLIEKDSNLSDRVIQKIKTKKRYKLNWILAAIIFLSVLAGTVIYLQNIKSNIKAVDPNNSQKINYPQIAQNSAVKNDTHNIQSYGLPDGSQIDLYPGTVITRVKNDLILDKGKLLATIAKQNIPINFKTKDVNCKIIGTKFIFQTYTQQNHPETELIVTEGLVEMTAFHKNELVKSNQWGLTSNSDQNLSVNSIQNYDDLTEMLNPDIIYSTSLKNSKVDGFWQNWSNISTSPSKNNLILTVDKKIAESFLQSQSFKTYSQNTEYLFEFQPNIQKGMIEVKFIFNNSGALYHIAGFTITKSDLETTIQHYQFNEGLRINTEKNTFKDSLPTLTVKGPINSRIVPLDEKDLSKHKICSCKLENISIKIVVKNLKDGEGHIELLNGKVKRILKN